MPAIGFTRAAIRHALATGRFHAVRRGVVAIRRADVGLRGYLKAVALAYAYAVVSHVSAALLWEMLEANLGAIHVTVPDGQHPRASDLVVHRCEPMPGATKRLGIPVTRPLETLIGLAATEPTDLVEKAVNEADKRGLIRVDEARSRLAAMSAARGTGRLSSVLEQHTVTDSRLEQRFLRIVRDTGLPMPQTQARVNGFRVDFFWPELGLVVETDGLTYHRTPAQQAKDRRRDQVHTAAGLTCLRFTNAQVTREPRDVASLLGVVAARLDASVRKRSL